MEINEMEDLVKYRNTQLWSAAQGGGWEIEGQSDTDPGKCTGEYAQRQADTTRVVWRITERAGGRVLATYTPKHFPDCASRFRGSCDCPYGEDLKGGAE